MYLNAARRGTGRLLSSPQRMHAAVMASFPPGSSLESPEGRVLWRVDAGRESTQLYVSSPSRPDLTVVVEQAGWPASDAAWQTAPLAPLLGSLSTGQTWRFRLTANPAYSKSQEGARGKRMGHVTPAQQEQWLVSRAAGWGFDVGASSECADVTGRHQLSFARSSDGVDRTVTVSTATFDGVLTVVDPDLLRRALGHGLGRAKAYGCGLLTLAPT